MSIRFIAGIAAVLLCGKAAAIELDLDNCTLQVGQEILKPVAVANPWWREYRVGSRRFLARENEVAKPKQDGDAGWTAKANDGRRLHWLAADRDVAYLLGYQVGEEDKQKRTSLQIAKASNRKRPAAVVALLQAVTKE